MNSSRIRILVIDDEELICWSLSKELEKEGYSVYTAMNGSKGLETFDEVGPEIILLDYKLPGMEGIDVLREMKLRDPSSVVIFMTAYGTLKTAVEAMREGAYEYVNKPFDIDEIKLLISRAIDAHRIEREVLDMRRALKKKHGFSNLIGDTPSMRKIRETIKQVARAETTNILVQGESGTGKEVVAKAIHYESQRSNLPFITINCAALPETLLESELFGYEKGAFTDAKHTKKGQLEFGEGGTVFLDEIGDISPAAQVKLLGLMENRVFKRLGGIRDIQMNVRMIVATNRDLEKAVHEGDFREDLYYRLKVIQILVPPLRERRPDIPSLCQYFLNRYNREFKRSVTGFEPDAAQALHDYRWPGNVRELRNVIERALILGNKPYISLDLLPSEISLRPRSRELEMTFDLPEDGFPLEEMERRLIMSALERTDGNQSQAARLLSVSRDTLRHRMRKFGLLKTPGQC